jgi:citrate synthase
MKLPDFRQDEAFNALRLKMGAKFILWEYQQNWQYTDSEEIIKRLQSKEGVEIDEILDLIQHDATFEYQGHKVLVYIRDWSFQIEGKVRERKYHLCYCNTLSTMKEKKRFFRYVASKRTTGEFLVNLLDQESKKIVKVDKDRKLDVCKVCRKRSNNPHLK